MKSLGELQTGEVTLLRVMEAALLLMGAGHLALAQEPDAIKKSAAKTSILNRHLCDKAQGTGEIGYLASPVTGGGVGVNRFEQLFLREIAQGRKDPQQWAKAAWALIKSQG